MESPICKLCKSHRVVHLRTPRCAYALAALYSRNMPWEIQVRNAPTEPPFGKRPKKLCRRKAARHPPGR